MGGIMKNMQLRDQKIELLKSKLISLNHNKAKAPRPTQKPFLDRQAESLNKRFDKYTENRCDFFEKPIDQCNGPWVKTQGRDMLMMASYSYLNLIDHPKVKSAANEAINNFGTGTHGVRILAGTLKLHHGLEKTIAKFKRTQDALAYSSGYVANLATISTLVGPGDYIICDKYDHTSIIDGCAISNGQLCYFEHNDMDSLAYQLKKAGNGGKLVVVDAVFSMDGDIADMPSIIELCRKYNANLMVDEAHSIGVIGKTGKGVEEHFDLPADAIDLKMGTLSKTIPAAGGYVAGKKKYISALKRNANAFVFSAAISPPIAAAAKAAIEIIENESHHITRLHSNIEKYLGAMKELGFNTLNSETAIVPIVCGTEDKTFEMTRICQEEGLFVLPVLYPAVPQKSPRLRTTVTSAHSEKDIDFSIEIMKKAGRATGLI
jgi:glycine C-acetyltransferase